MLWISSAWPAVEAGREVATVAVTPANRIVYCTVVVARKGATLAIASDSLITFGETRLPAGYEANDKVFRIGDSWMRYSNPKGGSILPA